MLHLNLLLGCTKIYCLVHFTLRMNNLNTKTIVSTITIIKTKNIKNNAVTINTLKNKYLIK